MKKPISYQYDDKGRFKTVDWSIAGQAGPQFTYNYVPDAELIQSLEAANGFRTSYGYEANRNNKTGVTNAFGQTVISSYRYVYDEINRRTAVENNGLAFLISHFNSYQYNNRSEVTGADSYEGMISAPGNALLDKSFGYTYDNIGNRLTYSNAHALKATYEANDLNQYVNIDNQGQPDQAPTYDPDGNLLQDGQWTNTWNAENRLIATESLNDPKIVGQQKLTFAYDYMGRRIKKAVATWNGSAFELEYTSTFIYDGWNMIREERDYAHAPDQAISYVHGLDLSGSLQGAGGIGGILTAVRESSTETNIHYFTYDANGNTGQLLDASGSIAAHYEYSPFGKTVAKSGPMANLNPYRFSTKYEDESGLLYYGFRYCSTIYGRFISRDPITYILKEEPRIYSFLSNKTINKIDFMGLFNCVDKAEAVYAYAVKLGLKNCLDKVICEYNCNDCNHRYNYKYKTIIICANRKLTYKKITHELQHVADHLAAGKCGEEIDCVSLFENEVMAYFCNVMMNKPDLTTSNPLFHDFRTRDIFVKAARSAKVAGQDEICYSGTVIYENKTVQDMLKDDVAIYDYIRKLNLDSHNCFHHRMKEEELYEELQFRRYKLSTRARTL